MLFRNVPRQPKIMHISRRGILCWNAMVLKTGVLDPPGELALLCLQRGDCKLTILWLQFHQAIHLLQSRSLIDSQNRGPQYECLVILLMHVVRTRQHACMYVCMDILQGRELHPSTYVSSSSASWTPLMPNRLAERPEPAWSLGRGPCLPFFCSTRNLSVNAYALLDTRPYP
jgi:hypothetical protein